MAVHVGDSKPALRESMRQLLKKKGASVAASPGMSSEASCVAATDAPVAAPANKADALKAMRKLLAKGKSTPGSAADSAEPRAEEVGPPVAAGEPPPTDGLPDIDDIDNDPWPEMPLSFTSLSVQDGQRRSEEIKRQGDFAAAARMRAKVLFVARRCKPTFSADAMSELEMAYAVDAFDADNWHVAERICCRVLSSPHDRLQPLCLRARARAERGDAAAAREDMSEAVALSQGLDRPDEDGEEMLEEQRALEARLQELQAKAIEAERAAAELEARRAAAALEAKRAAAAREAAERTAAGLRAERMAASTRVARIPPGASQRGTAAVESSLAGGDRGASAEIPQAAPATMEEVAEKPLLTNAAGQAADWNQAFFNRMEQDYSQLCEQDGWDDLRRQQEELHRTQPAREGIPSGSDYYRVTVPPDGGRLLKGSLDAMAAAAPKLPAVAPKRNLDELRRVEAATREAIERELAKSAERAKSGALPPKRNVFEHLVAELSDSDGDDAAPEVDKTPMPKSYVRGKSDVVHLDTLSDSDDGKEHEDENIGATLRAFEEFDRLGREKEAMLSKWRDRFG